MLEYGVEGPPEQETDMIKANTRAYDKWTQGGTHGPKGKVGGSTGRPADLPGRPTCPWAHRVNSATWRKLIGCLCRFGEDHLQNGLPLAMAPSYKYRGGGEMKHTTHPTQLTFSLEA